MQDEILCRRVSTNKDKNINKYPEQNNDGKSLCCCGEACSQTESIAKLNCLSIALFDSIGKASPATYWKKTTREERLVDIMSM
jgi:hypothetical protein